MNPLVVGGLALALLAIVAATIIDGNSFGVLFSPSSLVLVVFGTLGAGLVGYQLDEVKRLPKAVIQAVRGDAPDPDRTVTLLVSFANTARREGVLALERRLDEVDHHFVRQGLQLIVDGTDPDQVRQFLEIEIAATDERHQVGISLFKTLGTYAPTLGLLGTIIGLVNMLANLDDPAQLGIGMSLALLTTLYGVVFSNLVFNPIAEKLSRLNASELSALDLALDGILAVQAGASPRLLSERLETYLPREARLGYEQRLADAEQQTQAAVSGGAFAGEAA